MTAPQFHGVRTAFSATLALDTLGASLRAIRASCGFTWADMGLVLGKSDDRAAAYSAGLGDMGVVSFLLGAREWGGEFANDALALIGAKLVALDPDAASGPATATCLTRLLHQLCAALEDGEVDDAELAAMRGEIEAAGRAVDALRARLATLGAGE